jgi:adenylate cyclase
VLRAASAAVTGLAEFAATIGRAADLDVLVEVALEGLDRLFGFRHTLLLLVDESGTQLYTIASHGFDVESVGTEVAIGSGLIGLAAERCTPLRVDGLRQMEKYARAIRERVAPGREIPVPNIVGVQSRIVVPAVARGELVAVIVAESRHPVAFGRADEELLAVVGPLLGSAIENVRRAAVDTDDTAAPPQLEVPALDAPTGAAATSVRFFAVDGSVFVDDEYLIKGVAGRILWSLLRQHEASGRVDFTNRELRLDPSLDLPGFKDNLESRLILLKRRLDERGVPIRIHKTGRGRFRLEVTTALRLDGAET